MIQSLQNSKKTNFVIKPPNIDKFKAYEENIQELEKKGKEFLKKLNIEEMKSEISVSKKMIEVFVFINNYSLFCLQDSIIHLSDYKKKLDSEYAEELKELEEDYKKKRSIYFKEVLLKLHEEYAQINQLYNETS